MLSRRTILAFTAALVLAPGTAAAAWPERPLTIIVPYAAGGGADVVARVTAQGLQQQLGQPVNVVNRPGAGALTGNTEIAKAAPDGYTLGMLGTPLDTHRWLNPSAITYSDYTPLALINQDPAGFQVRANAPFKNFSEAIAAIKADPKKYTASASGIAGAWHVGWLKMMSAFGLPADAVVFIPTGGGGPSLNELVAGSVDFAPTSVVEARSLIEGGKVRALAVMAKQRDRFFPDVPTILEQTGVEVVQSAWRGYAVPKGVPDDIVKKLTAALKVVYESEPFRKQMETLGYNMVWAEGNDFHDFMKSQFESAGVVLKAAGVAK